MGYDLHITRKKNWDGFEDEHGPEISVDEWISLALIGLALALDVRSGNLNAGGWAQRNKRSGRVMPLRRSHTKAIKLVRAQGRYARTLSCVSMVFVKCACPKAECFGSTVQA
jgi:hypothetical protein